MVQWKGPLAQFGAMKTAVAAPDTALADRSRGKKEPFDVDAWSLLQNNEQSAPGIKTESGRNETQERSVPDTQSERLIKPKVELSVGIPDSSTPDLKTAVAAKPRPERRVIRLNKSTRDHFDKVIHSFTQKTDLVEDDVDYGTAGSGHDNDVESNVPDNDVQSQDADSADSADSADTAGTAVSGGHRRWKRD